MTYGAQLPFEILPLKKSAMLFVSVHGHGFNELHAMQHFQKGLNWYPLLYRKA